MARRRRRFALRLADTRDIAARRGEPDLDAARDLLLARCIDATDADGPVGIAELPSRVRGAAERGSRRLHEAAELSSR